MARALIRLGDSTSHGGTVIEASLKFTSDGIGIARVGDKVTYPIKGHGTNHIVSGDPTFIVDGQPVAREGDKTACGADLIPSQFVTTASNDTDATVAEPSIPDNGEWVGVKHHADHDEAFDEYFILADEHDGPPARNRFYRITLETGETIEGYSDDYGRTTFTMSDKRTPVKVEVGRQHDIQEGS